MALKLVVSPLSALVLRISAFCACFEGDHKICANSLSQSGLKLLKRALCSVGQPAACKLWSVFRKSSPHSGVGGALSLAHPRGTVNPSWKTDGGHVHCLRLPFQNKRIIKMERIPERFYKENKMQQTSSSTVVIVF